jgi:protein phosphatase
MGGAAAGDLASRLAVDAIAEHYYHDEWPGQPGQALVAAVHEANRAIYNTACGNSRLRGMGTTVTALVVHDGQAYVAQVGDSRCYILRGHRLRQVTEDHSYVAELVRQGTLTPEQARVHPDRNRIARVVGYEPAVTVDSFEVALSPGDTLVLSSDGLHGELTDSEIENAVATLPPQQAAEQLVAQVKSRGAPDNITVVIVQYGADPTRPAYSGRGRTGGVRALPSRSAVAQRRRRPVLIAVIVPAVVVFVGISVVVLIGSISHVNTGATERSLKSTDSGVKPPKQETTHQPSVAQKASSADSATAATLIEDWSTIKATLRGRRGSGSGHWEQIWARGEALFKKGDFSGAIKLFRQVREATK